MTKRRFPTSVYSVGSEPDPRFTLANERTFLAWIRTSLALIAGGVALITFDIPLPENFKTITSLLMLAAALILPLVALQHWAAAERALRENKPLPSSWAMPIPVFVIIVTAVALLVGEIVS